MFYNANDKIDNQLTTDSVNVAFTFAARRSTFRLPDAEADCPQRVRSRETDWCSNECDCSFIHLSRMTNSLLPNIACTANGCMHGCVALVSTRSVFAASRTVW